MELLESRRLLSGGVGSPVGVATGAGTDTNLWFTLGSNKIGMINPSIPGAGMTQYAIPTPNSVLGPIAPGPQSLLYASDRWSPNIYEIDKTTGKLIRTIPVADEQDSLIFDSHNDIIYSGYTDGGVSQVRRVDPTVGISSDTLLATIGNDDGDLALTPDGNTVIVTSRGTGTEYLVSLTNSNQKPTPFGNGQFIGGIVYDSSGRLFAVTPSGVDELDPKTFQVIASSGPLNNLDGLSFDPYSGNLFASTLYVSPVSNRMGIYEISLQPGTFLQGTLITSSTLPSTFRPDGIEPDGEGNVFVASYQQQVYQYKIPSGKWTDLTSTLPGLDDLVPLQGTGGHSVPDYWFYEEGADQFGMINPTNGQITALPFATSGSPQVEGIAPGPGGTLWFTESNTDRIGVICTDTRKITEFALPTPNAQPYGIVEGPDGNMWFTESGVNQIGMINTTTHVIHEYRIDSIGDDQAESITVGPDSNLWFTLTGTSRIGVMDPTTGTMIGEYGVPSVDAGLAQIVADPADGNLWFTEQAVDKVGRITASTKTVSEFPVPTAGAGPAALAIDKFGHVWFTESNAGKVGEFSPNNPENITEYSIPGASPPGSTGPGHSNPLGPSIVNESFLYVPKAHKKGKKAGKAAVAGFELFFNTAMDPTTAGRPSNYLLNVATKKHIKRKLVTVYNSLPLQAKYDPSQDSVTLTFNGTQTFAKGGYITINVTPPNGVSSASGDLLATNDNEIVILSKASGMWIR